MLDISLIMLGAGQSSRFGLAAKKQWLRLGDEPLWLYASRNLSKILPFKDIIIAASASELKYMSYFQTPFNSLQAGASRQQRLKNPLQLVNSEYVMTSDIARPCISTELVSRLVGAINNADCIVPALKVADTAVLGTKTINRDELKLIQTPQISRTALLKDALKENRDFIDDSSAIDAIRGKLWYVQGD